MEVCLRRIYPRWICSDLVVVCLCWCVFRLDPFDLCYSSSAAVAVLLRWSYEAFSTTTSRLSTTTSCARLREGGVMTAVRLWFALVLVDVARWSTDQYVIFIISGVPCTAMIKDE